MANLDEAEKLREELRLTRERLNAAEARADRLEQRQAPTRLLDYINNIDQSVSTVFTVMQGSGKSAGYATSADGKFYPQHFQPWTDFPRTHADLFSTLVRTFNTDGGAYFPSILSIEATGGDLSPVAADEQDLRPFIRASIEKPAAKIVSKYLEITNHPTVTAIRFQNHAYGLYASWSESSPALSQAEGQDGEGQSDRGRSPKRRSPTKVIGVPDRWAFASVRDGEPDVHVLVAEYKAAHKLPGDKIRRVMSAPPSDDFFQQAAKQDGASASENVNAGGYVLVAKVLCQAYHYMITSGLEFGYVASGEGLVLLRVLADDSNTLYYFWTTFPSNSTDTTAAPVVRVQTPPQETAIAYLSSLCIMAIDSTPRPAAWVSARVDELQRWPVSKKSTVLTPDSVPSMPPPRRDGEDGSGGGSSSGGGGGGGGSSGGGGSGDPSGKRSAGTRGALKRTRGSEPADGSEATSTRSFVVEPPTLPYCTQACLLGLCSGLPLDEKCPNAKLHAGASAGAGGGTPGSHVLTASDVRARVLAQLTDNMDKDCECLDRYGCFGRFGVLFKITVTGYGYTLVAKAVQRKRRFVLERETAVYDGLRAFQGRLIPVWVGLVDLKRPIPLRTCTSVAHLMLLSYAGPDLSNHSLRVNKALFAASTKVDWMAEAGRTCRELAAAGLEDNDLRKENVAWNEEVGRVMQFDFDQATLVDVATTPPQSEPEPQPEPEPQTQTCSPLLGKRDFYGSQYGKNPLTDTKRPRAII